MKSSTTKHVIYQLMTRLFGNKVATNTKYGTLEENGVGKFNDITSAALMGIKELGVTHVWYTGVIEHALLTDYTRFGIPLDHPDVVKGRAGSPYAIKDYYDVNPDLAEDVPNRMNEFESLVSRTHEQGLKVIIDFVPNHVARVYHSDVKPDDVDDLGEGDDPEVEFTTTNNFYYLQGQHFKTPQEVGAVRFEEFPAKATGNDQFSPSPSHNDWFETIKLNYGVDILNNRSTHFYPIPSTWEKMRDILLYWTGKQVDGFRCDMAEMVPVEFWQWVIPQIKNVNTGILFIAEIYNPDVYTTHIHEGKFDFLYDKVGLYDALRSLTTGQGAVMDIVHIMSGRTDVNGYLLHFMENHDEQRIASSFFAHDAWKAIPAMVISATIDKGPVMIYFGQEVGETGSGEEGFSGEDGRTTMFDYWGVPAHQQWMNKGKFDGGSLTGEQKKLREFYSGLFEVASYSESILSGDYEDLTQGNQTVGSFSQRIHAYTRFTSRELLVIVSSFNDQPEKIRVTLPDHLMNHVKFLPGQPITASDLLKSGTSVSFNDENSFELDIPPFNSYIFKIK